MGNDMLELESAEGNEGARILVIGVGGGGNNAVDRMIEKGIRGVEFVAVNTDKQQLDRTKASITVQIGEKLTRGLGAGANPEIGQKSAEESKDELTAMLKGSDMVFITCGMGGGTGTGATPVIADIAKSLGILTVAVVTKPFRYECKRYEYAEEGIEILKNCVDTLITIPNDRITDILKKEKEEYAKTQKSGKRRRVSVREALDKANQILHQAVQGVTQIIRSNGDINLDFADVKKIMKDKGTAHLGIGVSVRDEDDFEANPCLLALEDAISSPLLETTIVGATDVIAYFSGDIDMDEVNDAMTYLANIVGTGTNMIMGTNEDYSDNEDEGEEGIVQVTVIATGMSDRPQPVPEPEPIPVQRTVQRQPNVRPVPRAAIDTPEPAPVRKVYQHTKDFQQKNRSVAYPQSAVTKEPSALSENMGTTTDTGPQIPYFIDQARRNLHKKK